MRESVETRVVGMRSLISCMTRNISYRIAFFEWNVVRYMYVIACTFRWRVALVGEIFYWALLTLSWDPLSGTGGVQGDDALTRP